MEKDDVNSATGQGTEPPGQAGQYQHQPFGRQLPPGYVMDGTGQFFYTGPVAQPGFIPGGPAYVEQPRPENGTEQQAPPEPDYNQVIKSVEAFAEGEASVADVVKNLYATTARDDQFWKGAIVGAAAVVLLTNESIRQGMGKTIGSFFSGAKGQPEDEKADSSKSGETKKNKSESNKTDKSK